MFIEKATPSPVRLAPPLQIRLTEGNDRRFVSLAKALSRSQSDLGRELIVTGLDALTPQDASALLADYLSLCPYENGDLHLSSEAVEIFFVGAIDTDGAYRPPPRWQELYYDEDADLRGWIVALRAEMARMIPEEEGWSWAEYPLSHLVFAFSSILSDEGMDALCRMAEAEKLGKADRSWEEVWAEVSAL